MMHTLSPISAAFALLAGLTLILQAWLMGRQRRALKSCPITAQSHHPRAIAYSLAKLRLQHIEQTFHTAVAVALTLGGGLALMDQWLSTITAPSIHGIALLIGLFLITGSLDLPFSAYRTLVLEARHGFNRTPARLFWIDTAKHAVLGLTLVAVLAGGILLAMAALPHGWWLAGALLVVAIQLLIAVIYPLWIAPWFYQFEPLSGNPVAEPAEALLVRLKLVHQGLFVINASLRSSHGNAFVSGLGRTRRIVFFDTLLERLAPDEAVAVLAHELGHVCLRHLPRQLLSSALFVTGGLATLALLARSPAFYLGLGGATPSDAMALALFMVASPVALFVLRPLPAMLSRHYEFEADDFAARAGYAKPLADALARLSRDNAASPCPDPWYAAFYYSHPPTEQRIARLTHHPAPRRHHD